MSSDTHDKIRKAAVAGRFYFETRNELQQQLIDLFGSATNQGAVMPDTPARPRAIIVPHAGYVFSGKVAASGFACLMGTTPPKRIFVIGCSHHAHFSGASIYAGTQYQTPLGLVKIDEQVQQKLLSGNHIITHPEAHLNEHCIEVQLPFLQYVYHTTTQIVPLLIGNQNTTDCEKLAQALEPYFTPENLFVISTDLSHYPSYEDAKLFDKQTTHAVLTNSPEKLLHQLNKNQQAANRNLATSMCGWPAVYSLMHLTQPAEGYRYTPILYQNSGDNTLYGDHKRVVGYQSIAVYDNPIETNHFRFTISEQNELLYLTRQAIHNKLRLSEQDPLLPRKTNPQFEAHYGVFVSVYVSGELRGCIGQMIGKQPLWQLVQTMAVAASCNDGRFEPISGKELDLLSIEISVLSPLKKINDSHQFLPGKHGIYIKKGSQSGTYLPQVAEKTRWTREEMLGHCARDKAGLGWTGWKNAELYIYEAFIINENP